MVMDKNEMYQENMRLREALGSIDELIMSSPSLNITNIRIGRIIHDNLNPRL